MNIFTITYVNNLVLKNFLEIVLNNYIYEYKEISLILMYPTHNVYRNLMELELADVVHMHNCCERLPTPDIYNILTI